MGGSCSDNAMACDRLVNLELLLKFGPNAWRVFNEQLENYVNRSVHSGSTTAAGLHLAANKPTIA